MKKINFFVFAGIFALIWACQSDMPEPLTEDGPGWQLTYEEETLLNSSNEMTFNLLHFLENKYEDNNIFFSPVGIGNGVGIALNVINDESNLDLKKFLEIEEVSNIEVNKAYSRLSDLFGKNGTNNYFTNANSLWLNYNYTLNKGTSNQLMAYYSADVEYLDFDKSKHIRAIDNWANRRTHGDINSIIKVLNPRDESYLINLMKLNPDWTFAVKTERADLLLFTDGKGNEKSVPALKLAAGQYKMYESESLRLIDIPYGEYKFRFTVVQTTENNAEIMLKKLNKDTFFGYLNEAKFMLAEITIPEFKIEHELKLKEVFPKLVLDNSNTEEPNADINSISEFIHKSTIHVHGGKNDNTDLQNEESTVLTNYNNPINVDRPFIFFIREKVTGAIIFAGKVNNP